MKKFNQEKQTRFSLRKMSIGVCSVAIGLFFAAQCQQSNVEAATVQKSAAQVVAIKNAQDSTKAPTPNSVVKNQPAESTKQVINSSKNVGTTALNQADTDSHTVKTTENTTKAVTQTTNDKNVKPSDTSAPQKNNSQETYKNQWVKENGKSYFYNNDGNAVKNEWYTVPTKQTYYFDNNGQTVINKWFTFPGNQTYYFDNNGHTVKNRWYTMPTKQIYYFDNSGHTVRNKWFTFPSKQTYYFDNDGHTVKNQWYNFSNGTYYVGNDGHTVKNQWYKMPTGKTYYFTTTGHMVKNEWYTFSGNQTYYFDNDGHTVKNQWYKMPNGNTYYFTNDGHTVRNRWYSFSSGTYYYVGNDGHTVKNRAYTMPNGRSYYFNNNGSTIKNKKIWINGSQYSADETGALYPISLNGNAVNSYIFKHGIGHANISYQNAIPAVTGTYSGTNNGKPNMVVVHETADPHTSIQGEINFEHTHYNNAFVHAFVDANNIIQISPTEHEAWGAAYPANGRAVQFEQVEVYGGSNFARELVNAAYYTAYNMHKYGLTPSLAQSNGSGTLWSHHNVSQYLGGTDHVDPDGYWNNRARAYFGTGYNMNDFLQLVNYEYLKLD